MSGAAPTLDPRAAPAAVRELLDRVRPAIDGELERRLTVPGSDPGRLVEAMRYAATGPGKRLRPALVIAACEACGGTVADIVFGSRLKASSFPTCPTTRP